MSLLYSEAAISKEEVADAYEMLLCNDFYCEYYPYETVNELKSRYRLITIVDETEVFVGMILVNPKLDWEQIRQNLRGLIHNDGRLQNHIMGFFYGDVQGAYNGKRIHGYTFHLYYGAWNSIFFPLYNKCFQIHYDNAPSNILATTGIYDVLEELAKMHTSTPSIKYRFIEKTPYPHCDPDLKEGTAQPKTVILCDRTFPATQIEFDFRKVVRKKKDMKKSEIEEDEQPKPEEVCSFVSRYNAVQQFMIKERCILDNPLRSQICLNWGRKKSYKEAYNELLAETFGNINDYMLAVCKQFRLISLVDKEKDFVINILYDSFVHKNSLYAIMYRYADTTSGPVTVYVHTAELNTMIQSSYNFDVFYDKWGYYFKRLYPDSYAIPAYVYKKRKYFNYNFIFREFAHLLDFNRDKVRVNFCYFEQRIDNIVQPLDDDREFKPNPMTK